MYFLYSWGFGVILQMGKQVKYVHISMVGEFQIGVAGIEEVIIPSSCRMRIGG